MRFLPLRLLFISSCLMNAWSCPFLKGRRRKTAAVAAPPAPESVPGHHRRLLLRQQNYEPAYTPPPTEAPVGECPRPPTAPDTLLPVQAPTPEPSVDPTALPTSQPSASPITSQNTEQPTSEPSSLPSGEPSAAPPLSQTPVPTASQLPLLADPMCARGEILGVSQEELCVTATAIKAQFADLVQNADNAFKARLFGASLRVCFHDAGEVLVSDPTDRQGPDGCLQTVNMDNEGLVELDEEVNAILEPIWQEHCDKISRGDFWAFWGKLVVEFAASSPVSVDFYFGRVDRTDCSGGAGRLPQDSSQGMVDIQRVFVDQMGLTLEDAVALIGAHSVGHMSADVSGFGHPSDSPGASSVDFNAWDLTSWVLDNSFFHALLGAEWTVFLDEAGSHQAYSASPNLPLMMLNVDMELAYVIGGDETTPLQERCGPPNNCERQPSTLDIVNAFSDSNEFFLDEFAKSFTKMCNVGHSYDTGTEKFTGKLGTLTKMNCGGL